MNNRVTSEPWGPSRDGKQSYVHYVISQGKDTLIIINFSVSNLPSVNPNQFCALAHLGCTEN